MKKLGKRTNLNRDMDTPASAPRNWIKDSDIRYSLRESLCPPGIPVHVIQMPAIGLWCVVAAYNNERFYLVDEHDRPRTFTLAHNAKVIAEKVAGSAKAVRKLCKKK